MCDGGIELMIFPQIDLFRLHKRENCCGLARDTNILSSSAIIMQLSSHMWLMRHNDDNHCDYHIKNHWALLLQSVQYLNAYVWQWQRKNECMFVIRVLGITFRLPYTIGLSSLAYAEQIGMTFTYLLWILYILALRF